MRQAAVLRRFQRLHASAGLRRAVQTLAHSRMHHRLLTRSAISSHALRSVLQTHALVQHGMRLYLADVQQLSCDMFYQQVRDW